MTHRHSFRFIAGVFALLLSPLCVLAQNSNTIITVAGNGLGNFGDDGPAVQTALRRPTSAIADTVGNLYIADTDNELIRKVDVNGIITTIAGSLGVSGHDGDGGLAKDATLSTPRSLAFDKAGNLYFVDACVVRKIATTGIISTVVGDNRGWPVFCSASFLPNDGDGYSATSVSITPIRLTVDAAGIIYIAESNGGRIRKVSGGIITTLAQNTGTNPLFSPSSLAVDASGNLYIADTSGNGVGYLLKLTNGVITVVAGGAPLDYNGVSYGDNGPATKADLGEPTGVWIDSTNTLYVADSFNNAIRKITPDGIITTVAGGPHPSGGGFSGDGGPATAALLNDPSDVTVSASGIIYIADTVNDRIRAVGGNQVATGGPSLLVLANLSDNIYLGNNGYENYRWIGNNCTLPPNTCGDFAFAAGAYANQDNSQIVIAIRGTVLEPLQGADAFIETIGDVLADLSFGGHRPNGFLSLEVRHAAQFVQEVQATYPNARITLTGHSLGGAVAQLVSQASGLSAYVFNAPGSKAVYANLRIQGSLDGFSVVNTPNYANVNYRLYGEQISLLGEPFGPAITLSDPPYLVLTTSAKSSCRALLKEGSTLLYLHGIGLMIAQIADNALQVSPMGEPNIASACHLP